MDGETIYFDHAAATPLDVRVFEAMKPYWIDTFYNPSSPYAPAVQVKDAYNDAKARLARTIGAKADELVMTAGATESINLAVNSADGHIVSATVEHHAVLESLIDRPHTLVDSDMHGRVSADEIANAIQPDTQLVTVALANNELGTIQPLRKIAACIAEERTRRRARGDTTPIYLHSDASQGIGQIDVHVARLGVDLLTLNAGKIYGPKQVGALWARSDIRLRPLLRGGGQERGMRSGTENVAGTIGFAAAMELATKNPQREASRLQILRDRLEAMLRTAYPEAVISGDARHRLSGHLHISFPGLDAERLVFALEGRGVLVATGSACAANKGTRSHVLEAIGLPADVADGSLRLTLGHLSTEANVERGGHIIVEEIRREQERIRG